MNAFKTEGAMGVAPDASVTPTPRLTDAQIAELRGLHEAATRGPWAYRPREHDDWGEIRSDAGWMVAKARSGARPDDREEQRHREARTDPFGSNAKLIVATRNALPALLAAAEALPKVEAERDEARRDHLALQTVLVGETGASAMLTAGELTVRAETAEAQRDYTETRRRHWHAEACKENARAETAERISKELAEDFSQMRDAKNEQKSARYAAEAALATSRERVAVLEAERDEWRAAAESLASAPPTDDGWRTMEPVAWETLGEGSDRGVFLTEDYARHYAKTQGWSTVRPLYAAPPPAEPARPERKSEEEASR